LDEEQTDKLWLDATLDRHWLDAGFKKTAITQKEKTSSLGGDLL
jgi:hypothetical protein